MEKTLLEWLAAARHLCDYGSTGWRTLMNCQGNRYCCCDIYMTFLSHAQKVSTQRVDNDCTTPVTHVFAHFHYIFGDMSTFLRTMWHLHVEISNSRILGSSGFNKLVTKFQRKVSVVGWFIDAVVSLLTDPGGGHKHVQASYYVGSKSTIGKKIDSL